MKQEFTHLISGKHLHVINTGEFNYNFNCALFQPGDFIYIQQTNVELFFTRRQECIIMQQCNMHVMPITRRLLRSFFLCNFCNSVRNLAV